MSKTKLLITFLLGIAFAFYILVEYNMQDKERKYQKHQRIMSIKEKIKDELYIVKPSDARRLQDCTDESYVYHGGRIFTHGFMKYFDMKDDPINGFLYSHKKPIFNYIHGISNFNEETIILIGLRGDTAGPHRSGVTTNLYKLFQQYENTLIYMPGSFHAKNNGKIEDPNTILQSVCHRRTYDGEYIGSGWPGMSDGHSWEVINRLFKDKAKMFIFAYSNGQIIQDDVFRTKLLYGHSIPQYASVSNAFEFLQEYDSKTYFVKENEMGRISGVIDIETNYSGAYPLWDLAKFIKKEIDGNPQKIYYAACGIESVVAINHVKMIQALGLIGTELGNGVVRYMNDSRNVIIDILTYNKPDPYTYNHVNLVTQTIFLKDHRVGHRLSLGHYKIVPYVTDQFAKLAHERGILIK